MEMRSFKSIGRDISLLGFGCMRLPLTSKQSADIDYELGQQMVDMAIAAGVNYFDTAWPYHEGESENFIGKALEKYPRESFCLADKCPTWALKSADDVERYLDEQLKKCRVDYFDFYLAHALNKGYYSNAQSHKMYETLQRKKEEGIIRHLGFSFHDSPDMLRTIVADHDWDFAQIQLNYIDWTMCDAKQQYEILVEHDIPVIIMEPVRGGVLATLSESSAPILKNARPDESLASWALRYAASFPQVLTVLSGMTMPEHVADNIKTMAHFEPLTDAEHKLLDQVAALYLSSGSIPCTGCRYCMDCPAGVDIPRVFSLYNHYKLTNDKVAFINNYRTLRADQKAGSCVQCGQCVEHCPQGIDIPARLLEVKDFAGK